MRTGYAVAAAAALTLCLARPPAAAQTVALSGEWYDQDKVNDPVMGRNWYFEYFEVDEDGNGIWRPGDGLSKNFADTAGWDNWDIGYDATCWAAAASNMLRYVSGVNRYMDWVYQSDWPNGAEFTWQTRGGTYKALNAECYLTDGECPGTAWALDPTAWIEERLADGRPVSLGITGDPNSATAQGHLITCYAIDRTAQRITIVCSDTEAGGNDFGTYNYTYVGGVFEIWGYYARVNGIRTFEVNRWQGSGTGGKTSMGADDCYWDLAANWSAGHVPEAHPIDANDAAEKASRLPRVAFENAGLVIVRTADARAIKLILRGDPTHLMIDPGARLEVGGLFMECAVSYGLAVAGELQAARADSAGGQITVPGGRIDVVGVPGDSRSDMTFCGVTNVALYSGGSLNVGHDLNVFLDSDGAGRLYVSDGGFGGAAGSLTVGNDANFAAGCWASISGPSVTVDIGRNLELRGGSLAVTRSTVNVAGYLEASHDGDSEIGVHGGTLEVGYMFLGYGSGHTTSLTLDAHDGVAPQLLTRGSPMNLYMGWHGHAEVTQEAGSVMRADPGDPHPNVHLGYHATASGTYEMNGGTLVVNDLVLGLAGDGELTQRGGIVHVHDQLTLGNSTGGSGTYTMIDGTLNVQEIAAGSGTSQFNLGGGTLVLGGPAHAFGVLDVGTSPGVETTLALTARTIAAERVRLGYYDRGTLELSSTTLRVADDLVIGHGDYGHVEQTGGLVSADEILLANLPGAEASSYTLRSGSVRADLIRVGRLGYAAVRQYDGTVEANEIQVGVMNDAILNIYHHYGGTVDVGGLLLVGCEADTRGRYELLEDDPEAPSLLQTDATIVGHAGDGSMTQVAGEHVVDGELLIGNAVGSVGSYWMSGGDLTTEATLVGRYGAGEFTHLGGRHDANTLRIGISAAGQYDLSGAGSVTAANEYVGEGADANLAQSGGRNDVTGSVRLGGADGVTGTWTQSDGMSLIGGSLYVADANGSAGTYDQTGGTCDVAGSVYVGHGADANGIAGLGGETQTDIRQMIGGSLHIGCGPGSRGTYVTRGGGIYTATLDVAGDIHVGSDDGNGTFVMDGGEVTGGGTMVLAAGRGVLTGRGWIAVPVVNGNLIDASGFDDLRFGGHVSGPGEIVIGESGFVQLNAGADLSGPVSNDGFFHLLGGTYFLQGPVTGSGSFSIGGTTTAGASIKAGTLEIYGSLASDASVTAGQTTIYGSTVHELGDRDLGITALVGMMGMGGVYEMNGPGRLDTSELTNYGTFTQTGGHHVAGTIKIGGSDFGMMYPAPGSHEISGGRLDVGRLVIGHSDDPWMPAAEGTFSLTDPAAEVYVSEELVLGDSARLTIVEGAEIHMTGSTFVNESNVPAALCDLANLTLIFEGGEGVLDTFEVAGRDGGAGEGAADANFCLGTLQIGGDDEGHVQLVDGIDNQPDWDGSEVLYVEQLILADGSSLDAGGLSLYYRNGGDWKAYFAGDVGLDGAVDYLDYLTLKGHLGDLEAGRSDGDLDGDCDVDADDLAILEACFGQSTPPPPGSGVPAVPEPTTLLLLAAGAALMRRRRRPAA